MAGSGTLFTSSGYATRSGATISSFSVGAMASALADVLDAALHVEVVFRHVVVLAIEDFLEAADRRGGRPLPALAAGEPLRRAERLAEEALDLARAEDRLLVLGRQFVHA